MTISKIKKGFKKFYDNKRLFIATCVLLLTVSTVGVSYSAFFAVKTNSANQTIQTGTLAVTYSGSSPSLTVSNLLPMSDEAGLAQSSVKSIYIQNTSTLASKFVINVGYDLVNGSSSLNNLTPIDFVRLAVYKYENSTSTLIAGPLSISDLPIYTYNSDSKSNRYLLVLGNVGGTGSGNVSKTYQIKAWLSSNATPSASESGFYINSDVVARADGDTLNYTISGTLKNGSNTAINGATISLQNKSITATTNSSGAFTLTNVPVGSYNLDIISGSTTYSGSLTINESLGSSASVTTLTSPVSISGKSVYEVADTYKVAPGKIVNYNNYIQKIDDITLNGNVVIKNNFTLTGGLNSTITGLKITASADNTITMSL